MSENGAFHFGKFVPGFDFLQNLSQAASPGPKGPISGLGSWVAPTLSVEDIDKRIQELRTVHFWLEQNARALTATIQALEVQKMTLGALQGMNLNLSELAEAFKIKPSTPPADPAPAPAAFSAARPSEPEPEAEADPETDRSNADTAPPTDPAAGDAIATPPTATASGAAAALGVDPLHWWGALSQQFQHIAGQAMQDVAQRQAQRQASAPADASSPPPRPPRTKPARAPAAPARRAAAPAKTSPRSGTAQAAKARGRSRRDA